MAVNYYKTMAKQLWEGVVMGIAASTLVDGIGYAIFGNSITFGPSYALLRECPGGMHTFGGVFIGLSILLVLAVYLKGNFAETVMLLLFMFSVGIACAVGGGWVQEGAIAINPITKWFLIGWVSLWLAASRPERRRRTTDVRTSRGGADTVGRFRAVRRLRNDALAWHRVGCHGCGGSVHWTARHKRPTREQPHTTATR